MQTLQQGCWSKCSYSRSFQSIEGLLKFLKLKKLLRFTGWDGGKWVWKIRISLIQVDYPQTVVANVVDKSNHIHKEGEPAIYTECKTTVTGNNRCN